MRIVKNQAQQALARERSRLEAHCQRSQRQANKFAGLRLGNMSGAGVTALERRLHMRASLAEAQQGFCRSLMAADGSNASLVAALPETSPGVLDTNVAQERIACAQANIRSLRASCDQAVAQARAANSRARAKAREQGTTAHCVSISAIQDRYQALIGSQELIVGINERILEQAHKYEQASIELYGGVDTSMLARANASASSYVACGDWGTDTWAGELEFGRTVGAYRGTQAAGDGECLLSAFLAGDLKAGAAVARASAGTNASLGALDCTGVVSGELLGFSAALTPLAKSKVALEDDKRSEQFGVEATAKGYVARGKVSGAVGPAYVGADGALLTGAVSGTLGASVAKDGQFAPSLSAKAEASATAASGAVSARVGNGDYNYHAAAKGSGLTAEAEAGLAVGAKGVEVKAGAEAYVAKGSLASGFTFLGVTVDAVVEAKVAGAGAQAGVAVSTGAVEGELGLGLGIGLSAKIKVDWSGMPGAAGRTWQSISEWWDALIDGGGSKDG